MRRPALLTAAAVAAFVTTAVLAQPGIASAADDTARAVPTAAGTEWVGADDVTQFTGSGAFPAGWISDGLTEPTFAVDGMTITAPGIVAHSTSEPAVEALAGVSATTSDGPGTADLLASGDAHYALIVDLDGSADNTNATILTTTETTSDAVDGTWTSTAVVGDIPVGAAVPLADFREQIEATSPDATLNAYGVFAVQDDAKVVAVSWEGVSYYFLPQAEGNLSVPEPLTQTALRTTGLTVTASGFLPGETVNAVIVLADGTEVPADKSLVADAQGAIAGTTTVQAAVPAGAVTVVYSGTQSGIGVGFAVTVTADPAAAPAPVPAPQAPVATPIAANAAFTG